MVESVLAVPSSTSIIGGKSHTIEQKVRETLEKAGIVVDGPNPWDIQVYDPRFYSRLVRDRNLGLGDSYMDGWWDCEQIDEMICRLLRNGVDEDSSGLFRYLFRQLPRTLMNLQSHARTRLVAQHHYDLDNDLFSAFLDPYRQYSCGYFQNTDDLEQAQKNKLDMIGGKLNLTPEDHLLDVGCGWGGLARYTAEKFGNAVSAVNISREQLQFAREFCKDLPVSFQACDYRVIEGRFDKAVSVGMFEHVGPKNYHTYMKAIHRCLKDDGLFLLQTIGDNISSIGCDPWIARHIFPNGTLPSTAQIGRAVENLFIIESWQNLGPHYDRTLMAWNRNFQKAWPHLKTQYDERFKRMWEYYLLSCAGAFRARDIQTWQIVMRPRPKSFT